MGILYNIPENLIRCKIYQSTWQGRGVYAQREAERFEEDDVKGQLREMERRERLLRSDVQRAGEQVWNGRDGNITTGAMGSTGMWLPMGKDVLWKQKPSVLSTKPYHGTYLVIG